MITQEEMRQNWWMLKKPFWNMIDPVFEDEFTKLGLWGFCESNGKYGVLNGEKWDGYYNRPNTNEYVARYIFNQYISEKGNKFKKFGVDDRYYRAYCEMIGGYIVENFKRFFVDKTTPEYKEIRRILKSSWMSGIISLINVIYAVKKHYNDDIKKIVYSFNVGESDDFNGIDLIVDLLSDPVYNYQIKNGQISYSDENVTNLTGAFNSLIYPFCQYYIYFNKRDNNCVIFENRDTIKSGIQIETNSIIFNEVVEVNSSNLLRKIADICLTENIEIDIEDGDENYGNVNESGVTIKINDIFEMETIFESVLNDLNILAYGEHHETVN